MTIDILSGFSALTGEATKNVTNHCLHCFSMLGVPNQIKTGDGTDYFSQAFETFCGQLNITHITGIPYNPRDKVLLKEHIRLLRI